MSISSFKNVVCDCGLTLLVCQPESRAVFENLAKRAGPDYAVMLLAGSSATCPRCGKLYHLPPAESFDPERTGFAGLLDWLESRTPGQEPKEPPDPDIPF